MLFCGEKGMHPIESRVSSNFINAMVVAAVGSGGRVEHFPGVTCVRTAFPLSDFNSAFITEKAGVEPDILNRVCGFFDGLKSEWRLVVPPSVAEVFWDIPKRVPVTQWRREPEMILTSQFTSIWAMPLDLEIQAVRDIGQLQSWARTSSLGFETGDASFFDLFVKPENLAIKDTTMYIGTSDGKPVATSLLNISDNVAGIYAVCTLREFRGRGFGAAMTAFAVNDGFSKGCDLASLQSSPYGAPVYFKLGFRYVFDYQCWVVSPRASRAR